MRPVMAGFFVAKLFVSPRISTATGADSRGWEWRGMGLEVDQSLGFAQAKLGDRSVYNFLVR